MNEEEQNFWFPERNEKTRRTRMSSSSVVPIHRYVSYRYTHTDIYIERVREGDTHIAPI